MDSEFWRLLFIEDDEDDYFIVRKMLSEARPGKVEINWVSAYREGINALNGGLYDAILVDYDLGKDTGDQFIRDAIAGGCPSPILLLTGRGNYEIDLKAMQAGAFDYLNKRELSPAFLERSIRYAIERKRAERELAEANQALTRTNAQLAQADRENNQLLQDLKKTQALLDIALKNSDVFIYTTDFDLRYTWLYRPMSPFLPPDLVGKCDEELPEAASLSEITTLKKQALENNRGAHKEVQWGAGGQRTYLDCNVEPLHDSEGHLVGTVVSCINTTRFHQMEEQVRSSNDQVALQRMLMESREEERLQISRDLHDGPVQNTIGLLFSIQAALNMLPDDAMRSLLQGIQVDAQHLVNELRWVCNQLRPPVLTQFGLSKAIRAYSEEFVTKHPRLKLVLNLAEDGHKLPEATRLSLYRILQESLNNIIRHTRADEIQVLLDLDDQKVILSVQDNGEGFEMPENWTDLVKQGHLGLVGMKERIEALNGCFSVSSAIGKGTLITSEVPFTLKEIDARRQVLSDLPNQEDRAGDAN